MNLVSWLQRLMTNFGAGWVMWLLVVLSVISVAVMLERAWFYWSLRDNLAKLAHDLRDRLRANDLDGAKTVWEEIAGGIDGDTGDVLIRIAADEKTTGGFHKKLHLNHRAFQPDFVMDHERKAQQAEFHGSDR